MQYFKYDNDSIHPARWVKPGKTIPEIWSGRWVPINNPIRWTTCACQISKVEFDKLMAEYEAESKKGEAE